MDHLDGWRGLAIASVLWAHFIGSGPFDAGRFGVDLFFVLSGLLMSGILYEQRMPLGLFYRRRISRIVPVFFLFLLVVFGVGIALERPASGSEVLASFSFLRTYVGPPIWSAELPIGHIWSLNVEEHSYMVLATLAAIPFVARRPWPVLLVLGLATIAASITYVKLGSSVDWRLRTECAATGLLLSAAYRQMRRPHLPAWLPLVAFSAAAGCYVVGAAWYLQVILAPVCLAFAVNHLDDVYELVRRALAFAPLRYLGLWSYSLYLWQQPIFKAEALLPFPLLWALAVGVLSYYLFEQPVRRYLNAHWLPTRLQSSAIA